ncbi:hypothetical protein T484DRAFT_1769964 [Baffinella frigidus]|nr:hypothetical protein T484DRAFT_1769964 [Cryptophyta sp. CCMP2293]
MSRTAAWPHWCDGVGGSAAALLALLLWGNVTPAVGKHMRDKGGGAVVNTASMAAARGTPAMCAYVASKAALVGLTKTASKTNSVHI